MHETLHTRRRETRSVCTSQTRREGSLQGLTPSNDAVGSPPSATPSREGARARGESGSAGEGAAHRPYDPGRPGKSCRAAGIQPLNTGRTADGRPAFARRCRSAWRRRAEALGVPRASFYRRQRPAPGHQQPRPTPARALRASERAHVLDVLASPRFHVDRSPAEGRRDACSMKCRYLCAESGRCTGSMVPEFGRDQRDHVCCFNSAASISRKYSRSFSPT